MLAHEIPTDIQGALRELTRDYERQSDQARREYVRKCLRAHEFFRGNQYLWWDARIGEYRAPTQTGGLMSGATPQFAQNMYVINIYQGFAMSLIAILTANQPTQRFFPLRVDSPEDRRAADKANELLKIFERTQKSHDRLTDEVYLLWNDGTFGSYIHTVTDGDRFGWTEEKVTEPKAVPIGDDSYACKACGSLSTAPGPCSVCGSDVGQDSVIPAPTVTRDEVVGTKKKAKSKVVWDVVGGLELKLPPTAKTQTEFPYLIRSREVPKSAVRATYPEMASRIGRQMGGGGHSDSDTMLEVRARRQTAQGTTIDNRSVLVYQGDDVTLKEVWLRSTSFWQIDDEKTRAKLLELFPDGCRVVFADDLFCEVTQENMDDHWRICHALPGRGQVREPIGGTLVQIQEIVNDMTNIVRDVIEFTMPATFVDNEVLDVKKWARSNVIPGATYNVRPRGNRPVADAFWQTQPGQLPQYTAQLLSELRTEVPQFTVGAFPAAYGGGTPGNSLIDVDEPIPTKRGFVRNGDLADGDEVFGPDGKSYRVERAHEPRTTQAYRITFSDGTSVLAHDGHLWHTFTFAERKALARRTDEHRAKRRAERSPNRGGKKSLLFSETIAERNRREARPLPPPTGGVRTTLEIAATLLDGRGGSNHAIRVPEPFDVPPVALPIEPYCLGVWLGDGMSAGARLAQNDIDAVELAASFEAAGYPLKKNVTPLEWGIGGGFGGKLARLGLIRNKHVPEAYLFASKGQRLALLQGLMDTDGCCSTEHKSIFVNTNENLAQAVYSLAASLGCQPRITESVSEPIFNPEYDRWYGGGVRGFRVSWSSPVPVFRMKRKAARLPKKVRADVGWRYVVSVQPEGKRKMRCITTSNPAGTYLFGRNFNVTHNTASGIALEKDAAMGRIGIYWRVLKQHHSEVAPLLIKEFARRGEDPEIMTEVRDGGALASIIVSPGDFDTGEIQTFPESTEDYPTTWPQRQGMLMQGFQNPLLQGDMSKLSNWDNIKRTLGIDIEHRGEKAYKAQWEIIEQLVNSPPQMVPAPPDPMTGMPPIDPTTGQPVMQPQTTIPPGELDDHQPMFEACLDFDISERGMKLRVENPQGYQNFLLHALARKAAMAPPMPPGPPSPGGGGPGPAPEPQQGGGNG